MDPLPTQTNPAEQALLDAVLKTGVTLPSPSVAFARLQAMSVSDHFGPKDMAQVIQRDPALTGAMLRVANSPVFRPRAQAKSVLDAVNWLGRTRTLAIATSTALSSQLTGVEARLLQRLWDASFQAAEGAWRCAQASRARRLGDMAYLAALLQDVGLAVLLRRFPVHAYLFAEHEMESAARQLNAVTSTDHAALGGLVARNWKLPDEVVEAIRCHHDPEQAARLPEDSAAMVALMAFGRLIRDGLDAEGAQEEWQATWAPLADRLLGLDPTRLED